jgi:signal transduction histidine kinase
LFGTVNGELARAAVLAFMDEVSHMDEMPKLEAYDATKYAVAQHLVNLGLVGYFFSSALDAKNIVVVIGKDHITSVKTFIAGARGKHVAYDKIVEGTNTGGGYQQVSMTSALSEVVQIR